MDLQDVIYTLEDRIATIKLNRPQRLNAFGTQMKKDLRAAWKMFLEDPDARVAVLTGEGRAFCAGRDIKEQDQGLMGNATVYEYETDLPMPRHAPICDKPIIAAINGVTVGAGNAMAFTADIRIASEQATFFWPELATGILGPWHLAVEENIPWATACYLVLSGERISAQRAFGIGLVGKVVPHDRLMDEAMTVARHIASLPPRHLRYTMNFMHRARPKPLDPSQQERDAAYTELLDLADTREAARAFVERRRPVYTGE